MSGRLAIGVGCRRNCPAETIARVIDEARGLVGGARHAVLFTIADKRGEPGLIEAARALQLDLHYLSRDDLRSAMPGVVTPSAAAERRFGVASVAEAAALAGAGTGAALMLPRIARDGATCAIARPREGGP